MNSKALVFSLLTVSVLFSGCASYPDLIDDDVYVIGTGELPVGESLTDETSYAHYRENRRNEEDLSYFNDRGVFYQPMYPGYYPYYAMTYSPYWNSWGCNTGYSSWYHPYGCDFYYTSGWNPYYGMYMPYSIYGYSYGLNYGNYYSPYYFGSIQNYTGTPTQPITVSTNHHIGPRGSWVSNVNPSNRPNSQLGVLKSSQSNVTPPVYSVSRSESKRIKNRSFQLNEQRKEKSPLIHQERLKDNPTLPSRVNGPVQYNSTRPIQRVNPTTHERPVRYNNPPSAPRQTPASRPTPSSGRRL